MNEIDVMRLLHETENTLRNFNGENLFTQQVRKFNELMYDLPDSEQAQSALNRLRERLNPILEDTNIKLDSDTWAKLHFTLGRLDYLVEDFGKARGHFLNAAKHGMHEAMVFYNVAMTYAADISLDDKERKQQTIASLRMVIKSAGANSRPGIEAALHIRLLEMS
jgi:hypothetical protein